MNPLAWLVFCGMYTGSSEFSTFQLSNSSKSSIDNSNFLNQKISDNYISLLNACGVSSEWLNILFPHLKSQYSFNWEAGHAVPEINLNTKVHNGQHRIIGGTVSEKLPFYVLITVHLVVNSAEAIGKCGGSLIADNMVLSAAHCFRGISLIKDPNDVTISHGTKHVKASGVVTHKYFTENIQANSVFNDIAIIFLAETFNRSDNVEPIALGPPPPMGDLVWVAGYGTKLMRYYNSRSEPLFLMKVGLKVLSNQDCGKMYNCAIPKTQVCAYTPQKDACQGDSGGPLYIERCQRYILVGIVSYGWGCGDSRYPGVYTRIISYQSWISDKYDNQAQYYGQVRQG